MAESLNHVNPEYVTWKHEELQFALLGGIRIEGLYSMRVTLKVDFKSFRCWCKYAVREISVAYLY